MVRFINEGRDRSSRGERRSGREDDVDPMTSEYIERVRAIGCHVVSPLTVFAIKSSVRFLTGTRAVIL